MTDEVTDNGAAAGPAEFSLAVAEHETGYSSVLASGDVDLSTAPRLAAAVSRMQDRASRVLLDLRGVGFLGSVGLSVLVESARRAADNSGRLAVLVTSRAVLRAIEITGLDAVLRIFENEADAHTFLVD